MGQRKYIPKGSRLIVVACAFLLLRTYASGDIVKDVCDGEFLIEDGNYYDYVNVWDSATVTMIGGEVLYLQGFDSSILDYSGGHAWNIYMSGDATANVSTNECQSFYLDNFGKMHIQDGPASANLFTYDYSEFHVYGYNLSLDPNSAPQITGWWEDGRAFQITIRDVSSIIPEDHIFLHEIPEPCTIGLVCFGFLIAKGSVKTLRE